MQMFCEAKEMLCGLTKPNFLISTIVTKCSWFLVNLPFKVRVGVRQLVVMVIVSIQEMNASVWKFTQN